MIQRGGLREGREGNVTVDAQRQLVAGNPWVADLADQTHLFAFPVPADLPDADQVGRQPAIDGDPVELPVAPEGVDAKRGETTGDAEVSRLRPGGHVGAGDRDGPGGLRVADRGVAALDAYAPNADTKGPDLDVPGQGKDP